MTSSWFFLSTSDKTLHSVLLLYSLSVKSVNVERRRLQIFPQLNLPRIFFFVNKISPRYYDFDHLNVCKALLIFDIAYFYISADEIFVYILLVSVSFYSSTYDKTFQVK